MRPEDEYPFERNDRALISRVGTISAINGNKLSVTIPGGTLANISALRAPIAYAVGQTVYVQYDRDSAMVMGIVS